MPEAEVAELAEVAAREDAVVPESVAQVAFPTADDCPREEPLAAEASAEAERTADSWSAQERRMAVEALQLPLEEPSEAEA